MGVKSRFDIDHDHDNESIFNVLGLIKPGLQFFQIF